MARHRLPETDGHHNDQNSSRHTGDATSDGNPLPHCESLHVATSSSAPASTPTGATTAGANGGDGASKQQELSCTFDRYGRPDQKWGKIDLRMMPTRGTPNCLKTPWAAILEVKCRDVPHLMREGFFWSAENVLPEEGYLSPESRPEWTALGCRHKRTWILADQSDNGQGQRRDPQWVGRLEVVSPVPEALPGFRVQELSRSNVYSAAAWNAREQLVYRYDYRSPSKNCNCIYDDKPLKGWWPWPRDDGVCAAFPHVDDLFPLAPDSCSEWESESESESESDYGSW